MDPTAILRKPFDGELLSEEDAAALLRLPRGEARRPVYEAADRLNRELNGLRVSYVFNRNINFTNACEAACGFCAYSVQPGAPEAFILKWSAWRATRRDSTRSAWSAASIRR